MKSFRLFNRRTAAYVIAAAAILLGAFAPALAMAAQVSNRSIELSSSSKSATGVSYTVNFTAAGSAGAFVVDFCNESPIVGATCTPPAGLVVDTATSTTTNFTTTSKPTAETTAHNQLVIAKTGTIAGAETVSVVLDGITNPSTVGTIYARIVTYDTEAHAQAYTSAFDTSAQVGSVDNGGVAIPISETIGVSGAVLESMIFCVASGTIGDGCDVHLLASPAPNLQLGVDPGTGVKALTTTVSSGDIYTQISTNAASGAVINLKSSATSCGGLINSSKPTDCSILPALKTGISTGDAKFGVKLNTSTTTGNGIVQAVAGSGYSTTDYALNYAALNASGVTSPYGDAFLNTNDLPATNVNMKLTFGAQINSSTPAGNYSADLGLIATGKF